MDAVDSLAQCGDFALAERATLAELARDMVLRQFDVGEVIFHQEEAPDSAYLIESGSVRLTSATPTGGRRFLVDMHAHELLGEMSAVVQCPRSGTATALEPCSAWEIPATSLRATLESHPRVTYTMLRRVMKLTMDEDTEAATRVGLKPDQELASLILDLHAQRSGGIAIDNDVLAVRIGATRMQVIVALGRLERGGIVENNSGVLTVLNRERLRMIAQPG